MEDNKFRLSILSIFDNTLKLTWLASLLIITNFAIIVKKINEFNLNININLLLIISLSLFIIVVFIYYLVIYRISRYEITNDMVVTYKNIFVKDRKEILIKNIANICVSQNIFERIFKLIRMEIYANERNKMFCDFEVILNRKDYDRYILPFLEDNDFKYTNNAEESFIKFKIRDIVKHSILSIPISSIIVIINFIMLLFTMFQNGSLLKEISYNFLGLIITLVGFIFPVIYSVAKNLIKYLNYYVKRKNKNIYVSFGIFTKKLYIIPVSKINGLIADVSLLCAIFGCYKLNVITSGIGDSKNKLSMLFPIMKKKKCINILKLLLPEYEIPLKNKNQASKSLIVFGTKIIILMLMLVIPCIYINIKIALLISLSLLILTFIIYLIKRIVILDKYICVINGIFLKRLQIIRYEKIENVNIGDGIISKQMGICKVYISILGNLKNGKISSGYIKRIDAKNIVAKMSS